jgi:hypothetical protein
MLFPVGVEGTIALREDIVSLTNQMNVTLGHKAWTDIERVPGVAIGYDAFGSEGCVGIGRSAWAARRSTVAIGDNAKSAAFNSVAIGLNSYASADNSVQIHSGTNSVKNTLQFRDYQLVDAQGKIPAERLTAASILMKIKELNATELNELKTVLGID